MKFNHVFFSAPHRVMFFAGGVQTLLTMLLWAIDLGGRYAGLYPPISWPIPAIWLHATLMLFGVFAFFIFGFLMTALPKWVGMGPLSASDYVPAFGLLVGGWAVFYLGLLLPFLLPLALLLVAMGWRLGWRALWRSVRASINEQKAHAWAVLAASGAGAVGLLTMAAGLALTDVQLVSVAIEVGLWCFLVPVFFIVTHRMLPFFSGTVIRAYDEYRPMWTLWLMLGCCALHALLAALGLRTWLWIPDGAGALLMFWLVWRWQLHKSFVSHLLAMHHVAGLWLAVALASFALQSAVSAMGGGWGGRMPLHALTVGYFGSILLGMATRVTLGHSGRLISSDVWAWRLFWLFQCVIVLRLAGEFLDWSGPGNLVWLSALGWLGVFGLWGAVHLVMFLRPRPDGRPG